MKNLIRLAVFLVSLNAGHAFAGIKVIGNGGDAVVCYADAGRTTIKSVRMFDYWEQEQVLNYGPVLLGSPNISIQDKIEIASARISKFDPNLGAQIKVIALNLANNIQKYLETSYTLPEIDDAHPQALPTEPNCFIEQYGVQYKDLTTGQRRFSISDKFYNHMSTSNDDRAGIILHEAIYRYAIQINPSLDNSDRVRHFNYIIGSEYLNSLNIADVSKFHDILVKTQINKAECKLFDEIYLIDKWYEKISCYNQSLKLGLDFSATVTQGAKLKDQISMQAESGSGGTYFTKGVHVVQSNLNLPLVVKFKSGGVAKRFLVSGITLSETNLILSGINKNDKTFSVAKIQGPGGVEFSCQDFLNFDISNFEVIDCLVEKTPVVVNGQNILLRGYMKQVSQYRWIIEPGDALGSTPKYKLLGSKKSVSFGFGGGYPDINSRCKNNFITVDDKFNVVAGCFKYGVSAVINGHNVRLLNKFEVLWSHGQYFLKGEITNNFNGEGIKNPTFKNLRLIKSTDNEKFDFCSTLPFPPKTTEPHSKVSTEYVGFPGESFYDVSLDSVVYKSDEEVNVIDVVSCGSSNFLSSDY